MGPISAPRPISPSIVAVVDDSLIILIFGFELYSPEVYFSIYSLSPLETPCVSTPRKSFPIKTEVEFFAPSLDTPADSSIFSVTFVMFSTGTKILSLSGTLNLSNIYFSFIYFYILI